jgi:hypothetical protein
MRKPVVTAVVALALALAASPAMAFQCPLLIKQLKDHAAKLGADDARAKQARALIDEAQKLHSEASHARSVAKAEEAAKLLGIELTKN